MLLDMTDFKGPRDLNQLTRDAGPAQLMLAAARLERLNQRVRPYLPEHLRHCVRVGAMTERLLTLVLYDRAYATETRFSAPQLLESLKRHPEFKGLQNIQWKQARHRIPVKHHAETIHSEPIDDINAWLATAQARGASQSSSDG